MPRIAEILEPMTKLAENEGVKLLVENETSCNVATCADAAALLKLTSPTTFGLNLGTR